jgi:transposase, IS30 family
VHQSAIGTLVDRASRYVKLIHLPGGRSSQALQEALTLALLTLPPQARRTLTWDQGSEMACHDQIAHLFSDGVFFAYPGRPWERPSNENTNGLLRQYFPKRTDLSVHGAEDLEAVEQRLNNRPRKTLGWLTPTQVFAAGLPSP